MVALGLSSPCVSHFPPLSRSLACGFAPLRRCVFGCAVTHCFVVVPVRRRQGEDTATRQVVPASVLATRSKGQGKARPQCPRWQHPSGCGHDQTVPWIIWVPPHRLRLCSRARLLTGRLLSFPPFLFLFRFRFLYRRDAPATQAHSRWQI